MVPDSASCTCRPPRPASISLGFSVCDLGTTLELISKAVAREKSANNLFIEHLAETVVQTNALPLLVLYLLSLVTPLGPDSLISTKATR